MGSAIREAGAAASALGAYLTTVLPRARRELQRHGPLPAEKAKNAEAVAVFATLAPRSNRAAAVRAIVALQVAIDLCDELEESGEGEAEPDLTARIEGLEQRWLHDVATLPAHGAVLPHLERAVERCRQGQQHTHLAAERGRQVLERWALGLEAPPDYRWWEVAAGASSSVAAHALIAAAADPSTTPETAALIDAAYQPPIGALTVLLDDLVDRDANRAGGEHNYLSYYDSAEAAADRLAWIASRAEAELVPLPRASRHRAILAGVAAYYLSASTAKTPYGSPIHARLLEALGPGVRLLAGFMRVRRCGERK
ncbi:MAG: tetraprenyl-beta-curcumene synthase [Solirubrobacterales bacterium]|nr:tetraprenyl-beta-curcumene synthase [Solirubrobacterales bacterium]